MSKRRKTARNVLLGVLAVMAVALVAGGISLALRARARAGEVVDEFSTVRLRDEPLATSEGPLTAHVAYTSMAAADGHAVAADVVWDDEWFFADPDAYNHELATTCSVLSAVANAESSHYQVGSDAPAYMEDMLASLGFTEVSTASYLYRSEIIDEVLDFVTRKDDVVAYSVGLKPIVSRETGEERLLAAVSIRGSYGSEWLSDFNMLDAISAGNEVGANDHSGFMDACEDIRADLAETANRHPGEKIAVLVTGHSRGGATANLLASYLDDETTGPRAVAARDAIYAYTFATPTVTTFDNVDDALFDNIFNIMNPSDMVPRFPLESWGFKRYGKDRWLPRAGEAAFEAVYPAMRERFLENVGSPSPYEPTDVDALDALIERISAALPSQEDVATVGGAVEIVRGLLTEVNALRVLYGHYPNVYIAWMQALR